ACIEKKGQLSCPAVWVRHRHSGCERRKRKKSRRTRTMAAAGTATKRPKMPKRYPPTRTAKMTAKGCRPTLSPINQGEIKLFSIWLAAAKSKSTHSTVMGDLERASAAAGRKPKTG